MNRDDARKALSFSPAEAQGRVSPGSSEIAEPQTAGGRLPGFLLNPYLTLISRLVLGAIFIISGLTKLGIPSTFAASINSYEMPLPGPLVTIMAVGLPPLELAIGILLIVGLWTRISAAIAGALTVVFLVAMIQAMFRGLNPDCGCFAGPAASNPVGNAVMQALGPVGDFLANERVGAESIIRDLIFLVMSAHLILVPGIFSIDNWRSRHNEAEEYGDYPESESEGAEGE